MPIYSVSPLNRARLFAASFGSFVLLCLLLASGRVSGANSTIDSTLYVPGELLVTFTEDCAPNPSEVSNNPVTFGSSELDNIFASLGLTQITKVIESVVNPIGEAILIVDRMYVLAVDSEAQLNDIREALLESDCFESVSLNWIMPTAVCGTRRFEPGAETEFDLQWNLDTTITGDILDIDMPEAWEIQRGDASVIIGILDTGTMVDKTSTPWDLHDDFLFHWIDAEDWATPGGLTSEDFSCAQNYTDNNNDAIRDNIIGHNFTRAYQCSYPNGASCPVCIDPNNQELAAFYRGVPHNWQLEFDEINGHPSKPISWKVVEYLDHGVATASIAAARLEGSDIVGVAHGCKIYVLREYYGTALGDHVAMINHAARVCDVVNMSWGTANVFEFETAIRAAAQQHDCVLVAASGNINADESNLFVRYPAAYPEVLAVGAIAKDGNLTDYSQYTPGAEEVDVVAAVDYGIRADSHTRCPDDEFPCDITERPKTTGTGTSYAAPQATGVAALVRLRFPGLNEFDVRERIRNSAEFLWPNNALNRSYYGKGKLNAYRALTEQGTLTTNTTWTTNTLGPVQQGQAWVSRPGSRDGVYYVSSDLTVNSGVTLTIEAGTVVRIAPDHDRKGDDLDRVEITVNGTLNINGTVDQPVRFESFTDGAPATNDWVGIKFAAGSSGNIQHAIIKNAVKGIENRTSLTQLANCTFTGCETAIESHATLTADGLLVLNNDPSSTAPAVDVHSGTTTFTRCTFVSNLGPAMGARSGSTLSIQRCVTVDNDGPAVTEVGSWTGSETMQNSVVFGNTSDGTSRTDAQWQTTGQNVWNEDPVFCGAATGNYKVHALGPAAPGLHFTEHAGAFDAGCGPTASVSATAMAVACPQGDGPTDLVITVDFTDAEMTRNVAPSEISLKVSDVTAKVFDQDGPVTGETGATSTNGYVATIRHEWFGYYCKNNLADIVLNGFTLNSRANLHIRTVDCVSQFGVINLSDFATFGAHHTSPPKAYEPSCDFDDSGTIDQTDFDFFGLHYNHASPYPLRNAPAELVQSSAAIAMQFTEEFPTATTHRLYVDVDAQNFSDVEASVFSLIAGSERLSFVEWSPLGDSVGNVLFTPALRDGTPHLFFGVLVSDSYSGTSTRLGRLIFDVTDQEPLAITDDHFVLAIGDVLLESAGVGPVQAQMSGVFGRTFDPDVARIYHNRLEQNFPNPFNPTTTIAFSIRNAGNVNLVIYDVAGRRVRELVNDRRDRGAYTVVWDGRNDAGTTVSSGVYFYKLVSGSFRDTKKLTILK